MRASCASCAAWAPSSKRAELESRLVEEELEKRVAAHIEERVAAVMQSDAVQRELQQRLERERRAIEEQVRGVARARV